MHCIYKSSMSIIHLKIKVGRPGFGTVYFRGEGWLPLTAFFLAALHVTEARYSVFLARYSVANGASLEGPPPQV